jgi:predicted dehydrogenase
VRFCGTKGYLELNDFVLPYLGSELSFDVVNNVFNVHGCDFNMERHATRHAVSEYANSWPNAQETHLIRNFSNLVIGGSPDPQWPRYSLATQAVLDACFEAARSQQSVQPSLP